MVIPPFTAMLAGDAYEQAAATFDQNAVAAMPSLHVALTVVIAGVVAQFGRIWRGLGVAYVAAMCLALVYLGEHYVIEAKWQEKSASNEPVYQFAGKVSGKLHGRGLFISVNGFSTDVIRSLVMGKEIQTLFVDGEDLILVLEGHLTLREMIDRKVKAAQTKGCSRIALPSTSTGSKA